MASLIITPACGKLLEKRVKTGGKLLEKRDFIYLRVLTNIRLRCIIEVY